MPSLQSDDVKSIAVAVLEVDLEKFACPVRQRSTRHSIFDQFVGLEDHFDFVDLVVGTYE